MENPTPDKSVLKELHCGAYKNVVTVERPAGVTDEQWSVLAKKIIEALTIGMQVVVAGTILAMAKEQHACAAGAPESHNPSETIN